MVDEYMKTGKAEGLRCPKIRKKAFNLFHFCALKKYVNLCNKTNMLMYKTCFITYC